MSSENDAILMDASKSTAKMFAADRLQKVPPNESQQLMRMAATLKQTTTIMTQEVNCSERREACGSQVNLGASISAVDRSETPRMGNSNMRKNNTRTITQKSIAMVSSSIRI